MMRGATNNKKLCNDLLLTAAQILQAGEIICGSELGDSEPQEVSGRPRPNADEASTERDERKRVGLIADPANAHWQYSCLPASEQMSDQVAGTKTNRRLPPPVSSPRKARFAVMGCDRPTARLAEHGLRGNADN